MWPQASQLRIAARGENAEEDKSGAMMTGPWRVCTGCPEPGLVSDIHQRSVCIWWENKKAQEEVEERGRAGARSKEPESLCSAIPGPVDKTQVHLYHVHFLGINSPFLTLA